jgi:hypothetical protein
MMLSSGSSGLGRLPRRVYSSPRKLLEMWSSPECVQWISLTPPRVSEHRCHSNSGQEYGRLAHWREARSPGVRDETTIIRVARRLEEDADER